MKDSVPIKSEAPWQKTLAPLRLGSNSFWFLAGLILCVFLRCWNLGSASLWTDEQDSLMQSEILRDIWPKRGNGVLYFALLHFWRTFFGDSATALRSLSAFLGVLGVLGLASIARVLGGPRAGVKALLLASILPLLVWHARDARMYSLWAFGFLLAWKATLDFHREGPRLAVILTYVLGQGIGVLSHNYHFFFGGALALSSWFLAPQAKTRNRDWWLLHALPAAVAIAYGIRIALLSGFSFSYVSAWSANSGGFRPLASLGEILYYLTPGVLPPHASVLGVGIALLLLAAGIGIWKATSDDKPLRESFLFLLLFPFLLIHILPIRDYARLFHPTALVGIVAIAWASETPLWKNLSAPLRAGLTTLLLASLCLPLYRVLTEDAEPWKAACAFAKNYDPTRTILVSENRTSFAPLQQCGDLPFQSFHHSGDGVVYPEIMKAMATHSQVLLFRSPPWVPSENSMQASFRNQLQVGKQFPLGAYLTLQYFERVIPDGRKHESQSRILKSSRRR